MNLLTAGQLEKSERTLISSSLSPDPLMSVGSLLHIPQILCNILDLMKVSEDFLSTFINLSLGGKEREST